MLLEELKELELQCSAPLGTFPLSGSYTMASGTDSKSLSHDSACGRPFVNKW
jgi:hypothetical protein